MKEAGGGEKLLDTGLGNTFFWLQKHKQQKQKQINGVVLDYKAPAQPRKSSTEWRDNDNVEGNIRKPFIWSIGVLVQYM